MLNLQSNALLNTESSTSTQAVERWDHSGFDRLQKEDEGIWHKIKNPKKQKVAAEGDYKRPNQRNNSKWTNNKEDNDISTRVTNDTKHGSKGTRKDRKPDRQLYSVRDKRADNQTQNNNNNRKTRAGNNMALPLNMVKEAEGHAFDDDKSFVSNVSTAISERLKIEDDQEKVMLLGNEYQSLNTSSPKTSNEENRVLFSLCLGVEDNNSFETVFIYEGETDYEGFLDEVCTRYGILDRTALYFKINVLQMIMGVHSNPSVVEPTLNKFLDINYNLLLTEVETEEDVASPLFYGENEDSFAGNTSTDSC